MGFGDELMALGRCETIFARTGKSVAILDKYGQRRAHELWRGNPAWDIRSKTTITDGPGGARPYILRYEGARIIFDTLYRPRAGRVVLTASEDRCTIEGPFAVVSPFIKEQASPNKSWGVKRWQKVIGDFPIPVYQLGPVQGRTLKGAQFHATPDMRRAAAVVSRAALVLTNEGGMHHLAASMNRPAVVVFGGFTDPDVTGYRQHVNLVGENGHRGCGRYDPCLECEMAMASISPDVVRKEAERLLHESERS